MKDEAQTPEEPASAAIVEEVPDIRPALPRPVAAWVTSHLDCVVMLDDGKNILAGAIEIQDTGSYRLVRCNDTLWQLWRSAEQAMRGLGFTAEKFRGEWALRIRPLPNAREAFVASKDALRAELAVPEPTPVTEPEPEPEPEPETKPWRHSTQEERIRNTHPSRWM